MRLVPAILLFCSLSAQAVLIPAERLATWTPGVTVGVPGGIPTNRVISTNVVVDFGADNTGVANAQAAIQAAINAAPSNTIVYFPAGTYSVTGILTPKTGITLRGAGTNTIIRFGAGESYLYGSESDWQWANDLSTYPLAASATLTKGATAIPMAGDISTWVANKPVCVAGFASTNQYDTNLFGVHVSGTNGAYGYMFAPIYMVTNITGGDTIHIWPPLVYDFTKTIVHVSQNSDAVPPCLLGIEDLVIDSTDTTQTGASIKLMGFHKSWMKNVVVRSYPQRGVWIENCMWFEIRGCTIKDQTKPMLESNHAGLWFVQCSFCLFEDNIFQHSFSCIEAQKSAGNVVAYNFMLNSNSVMNEVTEVPIVEADSHGAHCAFNLYEGNFMPRFQSDGYWGSESYTVLLRNWLSGMTIKALTVDTNWDWCFSLKRFSRQFALVGNILGHPAYSGPPDGDGTSYCYPNMGNSGFSGTAPPWANWGTAGGSGGFQEWDTGVTNTLYHIGNYYVRSNGIPAGESLGGDTLTNSLMYASKPSWFGYLPWPPYDATNAGAVSIAAIPAGFRYLYGTNPPAGESPPMGSGILVNRGPTTRLFYFTTAINGNFIDNMITLLPGQSSAFGLGSGIGFYPFIRCGPSPTVSTNLPGGTAYSGFITYTGTNYVWEELGPPPAAPLTFNLSILSIGGQKISLITTNK